MSPRSALLGALLLAGCATDDFVIFGESETCPSTGVHEDEAELEEIDAAPVSNPGLAEMTPRPAPQARSAAPGGDPGPRSRTSPTGAAGPVNPPLNAMTLPAAASAQERQ